MCGIAGLIRFDGSAALDGRAIVANMVRNVRHRGPDDDGVQQLDDATVFGHTRLSIIDLSSAGHQPMLSPDQMLAVTYNGEIYNFAD
ncbi:MAG: asparagine synthetase B, partial [Chloroflexi bacterium]|nr:asparagine synthetase B [Chloroflexota bacterium]